MTENTNNAIILYDPHNSPYMADIIEYNHVKLLFV